MSRNIETQRTRVDGEYWTRDDYRLPETGVLTLTYRDTPNVPRMEDVVDEGMLKLIVRYMQHRTVADQGLSLLRLAAQEFFFSSEQV